MSYCDDCGSKVYSGACVNCHEMVYIAEQHVELGTWDECGPEFKRDVESAERDIERKRMIKNSF